jgi:hypothetical protein
MNRSLCTPAIPAAMAASTPTSGCPLVDCPSVTTTMCLLAVPLALAKASAATRILISIFVELSLQESPSIAAFSVLRCGLCGEDEPNESMPTTTSDVLANSVRTRRDSSGNAAIKALAPSRAQSPRCWPPLGAICPVTHPMLTLLSITSAMSSASANSPPAPRSSRVRQQGLVLPSRCRLPRRESWRLPRQAVRKRREKHKQKAQR